MADGEVPLLLRAAWRHLGGRLLHAARQNEPGELLPCESVLDGDFQKKLSDNSNFLPHPALRWNLYAYHSELSCLKVETRYVAGASECRRPPGLLQPPARGAGHDRAGRHRPQRCVSDTFTAPHLSPSTVHPHAVTHSYVRMPAVKVSPMALAAVTIPLVSGTYCTFGLHDEQPLLSAPNTCAVKVCSQPEATALTKTSGCR